MMTHLSSRSMIMATGSTLRNATINLFKAGILAVVTIGVIIIVVGCYGQKLPIKDSIVVAVCLLS